MRKVIVKVAVALLVLSQECYIIHHIKCDNNNQEITRATKEVIKEITSIEQDSSSLFTKDGLSPFEKWEAFGTMFSGALISFAHSSLYFLTLPV